MNTGLAFRASTYLRKGDLIFGVHILEIYFSYLPSFQSEVRFVMFHFGRRACSHWTMTFFVDTL